MTVKSTYKAYFVNKEGKEPATTSIVQRSIENLPAGDVTIEVLYSSLNYKDALSATGAPGVTRNYPHVPGIDAAGTVIASETNQFHVGDNVLVTGYDLGMDTDGGYGQYIRVPANWVVPLPEGLSLKKSMILGTAGFTAALCVNLLLQNNLKPENGEVVVTGATGGVGSLAVALLSTLGYTVVASTGKNSEHDYLKSLGAATVIDRAELDDQSGRPLLKARWASAVDTVGGNTLSTVIKSTKLEGSVAACGVAGGSELNLTVFPFILRGIRLLGADSAMCPMDLRLKLWQKLATDWKINTLGEIHHTIKLEDLDDYIDKILKGQIRGRMLVDLGE